MSKPYAASDYAGLKTKKYEFYYGYEKTVCKSHGDDCVIGGDFDDCDENEWAFVASETDGKELMRIGASKLGLDERDHEETALALLHGIGIFMDKHA